MRDEEKRTNENEGKTCFGRNMFLEGKTRPPSFFFSNVGYIYLLTNWLTLAWVPRARVNGHVDAHIIGQHYTP